MYTFFIILGCSLWCLYTHIAWYINGTLPYPPSIFSNNSLILHSLKLFSINWSFLIGFVGVLFSIFLFSRIIRDKKSVEVNMIESKVWFFVAIAYIIITLMTFF